MSVQSVREFISRHLAASTGLAALGAALDARASGVPLDPAIAARIDDLLTALGAGNALDEVNAADALPLLAELRVTLGSDAKLLYPQTRSIGWTHPEPELLQAAGDTSAGFAHGLTHVVAPALDGLAERLGKPGAAFLDIGVGVAGLAIALARLWPELRVVGIDTWQPSLVRARTNVERAGLRTRIELREQRAESLEDDAAFDLAWVPLPFMSEQVIPATLQRARRAVRPGGWALIGLTNPGPDPAMAAVVRLRTTMWGGPLLSTGNAEHLLRDAGFTEVVSLPTPPGSIVALVAGRRPA